MAVLDVNKPLTRVMEIPPADMMKWVEYALNRLVFADSSAIQIDAITQKSGPSSVFAIQFHFPVETVDGEDSGDDGE